MNGSFETIDIPSRNVKITVATLEKELENWKDKYNRLQVINSKIVFHFIVKAYLSHFLELKESYENSEKVSRQWASRFSKFTPLLSQLGVLNNESIKLKRSSSEEDLTTLKVNSILNKQAPVNGPSAEKKDSESFLEKINASKDIYEARLKKQTENIEKLESQLKNKNEEINEHYKRLLIIYDNFKVNSIDLLFLKLIKTF
jgi:hypothetical protein